MLGQEQQLTHVWQLAGYSIFQWEEIGLHARVSSWKHGEKVILWCEMFKDRNDNANDN